MSNVTANVTPNRNVLENTISSWWRLQMEKCSALLALCVGNSPVTGEFPSQGPVTQSFDVFCTWTNSWVKQSRRRWFETPSPSLWRHCNSGVLAGDPYAYGPCEQLHTWLCLFYLLRFHATRQFAKCKPSINVLISLFFSVHVINTSGGGK